MWSRVGDRLLTARMATAIYEYFLLLTWFEALYRIVASLIYQCHTLLHIYLVLSINFYRLSLRVLRSQLHILIRRLDFFNFYVIKRMSFRIEVSSVG